MKILKRALSLLVAATMTLTLADFSEIDFSIIEGTEEEIEINESNFPDDNFRNYVSSKEIDTTEDGFLSDEELSCVTSIDVSGKIISSLEGIKYFKNLQTLNCSSNELSSLDLSKTPSLNYLDCSSNELSSLDLSQNTQLYILNCSSNQHTIFTTDGTFDLSTLPGGFDVDNAEISAGGTIQGKILIIDDDASTVTYGYNLGNNEKEKFKLNVMKVSNASLSLGSDIAVNFYVSVPDEFDTTNKKITLINTDDLKCEKAFPTAEDNKTYKFSIPVSAKDYKENVAISYNGVKKIYSVDNYISNIIEHKDEYENSIEIANALLNYASSAKSYFSDEQVAETNEMKDINAQTLNEYEYSNNNTVEGISYYGSSLLLKSKTIVRHYFKLESEADITEYEFKINNTVVEPTEKQGYYYIESGDINASELGTPHSVTINDKEVISNYSALSYVKSVITKSKDQNLVNTVKALYLYNKAAISYINQ